MPNIRINALPTTASASSSDDYIALDGTTNGTRKLDAYSPTFGGNLTVSGGLNLTSSTTNSYIYDGTGWVWTSNGLSSGTVKGGIYTAGGSLFLTANSSLATNRFSLDSNGNATVAGNLTVSGTASSFGGTSVGGGEVVSIRGSGTSAQLRIAGAGGDYLQSLTLGYDTVSSYGFLQANFAGTGVKPFVVNPSGGNLLIGTTTDGGQKLQVNGNSGFLGHIEIPADKHIYLKDGNPARWSSTGLSTGTLIADIYASSNSLYFRTNGATTALTLDSSQRCILAGALRLNNAYTAGAPTATGYVTIQDSAGNTYKVLVGT